MQASPVTEYTIDAEDRITAVGPSWDPFARGNGGDGAHLFDPVGHPVWAFLQGAQVRSVLNAVFFAVRSEGRPLSLFQRCDSPGLIRTYRMTVAPLEAGGLHIRHDPCGDTPCGPLPDDHPIWALTDVTRCALCCDYLLGEAWVTVPFGWGQGRAVHNHRVCPTCRAAAAQAVQALRGLV